MVNKIGMIGSFLEMILLFPKMPLIILTCDKYFNIFNAMKKLSLVLAFGVLIFASSCTSYTCPTYAKMDMKQDQSVELNEENL